MINSRAGNLPNIPENMDFTGISTDTRTLLPGNLFFALEGQNYNGHDFIAQAFEKGAAGVVISEMNFKGYNLYAHKLILVENTLKLLGEITRDWRKKFTLPVIGVTGSNGKTTTKNMIAAIFKTSQKPVLATEGNLNNHIGVPLTLAKLNENHSCAVIEMGMNHTGEIAYLTQLVKPDIAVITNAGPCHLEGAGGNIAGVAKAKAEIFEGLSSQGTAVINQDDDFAEYWKKLNKNNKIITFGFDPCADVRGEIVNLNDFNNQFKLYYAGDFIIINLKLWGKHNIDNALAASAAGIIKGVSLEKIKFALENILPEKGRLEIKSGINQVTIVDDTYNANPLSFRAAIQTLHGLGKKYHQKILVLGDMGELGEHAESMHGECGEFAQQNGIDILLATGRLSYYAVQRFGKNGFYFDTKQDLITALKNYLNKNNIILIKASHAMQMSQIVQAIEINTDKI